MYNEYITSIYIYDDFFPVYIINGNNNNNYIITKTERKKKCFKFNAIYFCVRVYINTSNHLSFNNIPEYFISIINISIEIFKGMQSFFLIYNIQCV